MTAVFVYGLLKPGFRLHHVVEPYLVELTPARVRGRLYDADPDAGGLPAARFDEEGEIEGYVFELDPFRLDEALSALDDLEDEGEVYRRIVVRALTEGGAVEAFAYEYLGWLPAERRVGPSWESAGESPGREPGPPG